MTSSITIVDYLARFSINTDHSNCLEFVLDDVGDRTGTDYYDVLENMLNAEFESVKTVRIEQMQVYYDVSVLISAASPAELEWALEKCAGVVSRWINKYRINSMKQKED